VHIQHIVSDTLPRVWSSLSQDDFAVSLNSLRQTQRDTQRVAERAMRIVICLWAQQKVAYYKQSSVPQKALVLSVLLPWELFVATKSLQSISFTFVQEFVLRGRAQDSQIPSCWIRRLPRRALGVKK